MLGGVIATIAIGTPAPAVTEATPEKGDNRKSTSETPIVVVQPRESESPRPSRFDRLTRAREPRSQSGAEDAPLHVPCKIYYPTLRALDPAQR